MDFFPVELTVDEMVYIDEIVDDILQERNLFTLCPSDTVLSFLQEGHYLSPWLSHQVHHPFREHAATQRFLRQYNSLEIPSHLSLHDFMLE